MDQTAANVRLAYITCGDLPEAERIGRALVGERLAGCVNILPGMRSIFRWEGRIEENQEVVLIAKTCVAHMDDLAMRVKSLHHYSTPCVLFLPVVGGNPAFLEWLQAEMVPRGTTTVLRRGPPVGPTAAPPPG